MLSAEGSLSGVVVVASDITDLLAAREDAEAQRERSRMIISLVENKKQAISFLKEADEILFKLQAELRDSWDSIEIYRHLHTLKGGAGSFAIREIVEQCHKMETIVTESKDAPDFKTHLQENFLTLQKLFANFEMNSTQLLGDRKHRDLRRAEVSEPEIIEFLQAHTPQTQWQPLHQQFENRFFFDDPAALVSGFAEMSKELAESQGKALLNFTVLAKDKRIDGQAWSPFLNNLVHVYRNAIDHGLETKAERLEAGKPEGGSITTSFNFDANLHQWQILIEDDGRGINAEKLKSKLVEKGLDLKGENESQILQHIFDPQVSTKDEVSEISGRGVGLDAVKAFVVSHGGSIVVHSKLGAGCRFEIWLPDLSSKAPVKMAA
jgi:two-component system chemotaxis sensor kinase CheA